MSSHKRKALGKGLDALIPENRDIKEKILEIDVNLIDPNPYQPRSFIEDPNLISLIDSIKEKGIIEPIIVRDKPGNRYEVVCGERRLEASKRAGKEKIPSIVKDLSDRESLELALVENIQRESLNPIDEARGFKRLMDEFGATQEDVAREIGKSRASITNTIRLLRLPMFIQEMIIRDEIKEGHARVLLRIDSDVDKINIARRVKKNGLSVRDVEKLIEPKFKRKKKEENPDLYIQEIELQLSRYLGTKVKINRNGSKGRIKIDFYSDEEFARIIETIGQFKNEEV
ncbi:ParB/RepB/Spo0J family partition protein [candidate division WOR-3 bacterium]|jgi:ParB family chromosome partitioning protein|nr:ParB/RepB/Spo0J family partition protein [candidate division WOR-3 bacterium]